jgi:hypothetical protein
MLRNRLLPCFFSLGLSLLLAELLLNSSMASSSVALQEQQLIPKIKLEDVNGTQHSTYGYSNRIQIYSFADHNSADRLKEWMLKVQSTILDQYPHLSIVYFSFADLSLVPPLLKSTASMAMQYMNNRSVEQMQDFYQTKGITLNPQQTSFVLVPDWSGAYLQYFGIDHAEQFHCIIAYNHKVEANLSESSAGLSQTFLSTISRIADELEK